MNRQTKNILIVLGVLAAIGLVVGLVLHFTGRNRVNRREQQERNNVTGVVSDIVNQYETFDNSFIEGMTDMHAEEEAMEDALESVQEGFHNDEGIMVQEGFDSQPQDLGAPENTNQLPSDCYPKDINTAADLLPTDANSLYAQVVPNGQGALTDQNFLTAGYHIGINTVGQTLRNANRQLRSEPPNPQVKISPWNQTTIEPDSNRRPFEVGGQ